MRSFPLKIIAEIEKNSKKINPILFYGNESGLIHSLIKSIFNVLQKKNNIPNITYFDYKNNKDEKLEYILNDSSLFSKINFIVVNNPLEQLVEELENIKEIYNILIINGENIVSSSKIKSYFDNHQSFLSVPCYKLNKKDIKITIDSFLNKNNIHLHSEAYWFLIDSISEDYLALQNELQKLYIFKNSSVNLKSLQNLIVQKNNINADNYFFNCAAGNSKLILQNMSLLNKSLNDSIDVLGSIKKFNHILSMAVINKNNHALDDLVRIYLPKYLFLKKESFREILKKTNLNKITKINIMLQKTEFLLRKNSEQHREILERFLLNLSKILK